MQAGRRIPSTLLFAAGLGTLLLAACDRPPRQAASPAAAAPVPVVTVLKAQPESVPLVTELPGRTAARLIAEIRPQVTGIIKERPFEEGSEVKAGQVLYQIEPAPYQAAFDSAKANVERAEANLVVARLKAKRYAGLEKNDAVSKQANDEALAEAQKAEAEVAAARAALDKAGIDLNFTRVRSPIAGRIGRSAVTPGALVTANQAMALATVQQLDPINVDLTESSAERLRIERQLESAKLQRAEGSTVPVKLVLEDGSLYGLEGKLAFSEVSVHEATGTVTLRAVFPNPDRQLLPGMYVRARLSHGLNRQAVLLPHAALSRNPRGQAQVMVVDAEEKVEARNVEAERSHGEKWVVTAGLKAGDRVIVEGLQKVRPGAVVKAEEAGAPKQAAPAPAGAAAR
jgi:membrane fusion protein (multidrug efflux system)